MSSRRFFPDNQNVPKCLSNLLLQVSNLSTRWNVFKFAEKLQKAKGKLQTHSLARRCFSFERVRGDIQEGRLPKPRELTQRVNSGDLLFQHGGIFDRSWLAVYSLGQLPLRRIPVRRQERTGTHTRCESTQLCVGVAACTG